jgi:hypothetical protein
VFSSKLFLIIACVTLLLVFATLYFQVNEAIEYNMIDTLQEELLGGVTDSADSADSDSAEEAK